MRRTLAQKKPELCLHPISLWGQLIMRSTPNIVMDANQVVPQILMRAPPDIVVLWYSTIPSLQTADCRQYIKNILYLGSSVGVSRTTTGQASTGDQQYQGVLLTHHFRWLRVALGYCLVSFAVQQSRVLYWCAFLHKLVNCFNSAIFLVRVA